MKTQIYNNNDYKTINPSLTDFQDSSFSQTYINTNNSTTTAGSRNTIKSAPTSPLPVPSLRPPTPTLLSSSYHPAMTSSASSSMIPQPLSFHSIDTFSKKVEETLFLEQCELLNTLKSQNQLIETQKHVRSLFCSSRTIAPRARAGWS